LAGRLADAVVTAVPAAGGTADTPAAGAWRSMMASLALGLPAIDRHLGGGLVQAALHEIAGTGSDAELATLPAFFASQLLRRHTDRRAIWISPQVDLYGPGLLAQGLDPSRLLLVETRQDAESLWCLEEATRSGAVSLVIGEIDALDLTASRRLQLAAEEKNCTILVLRRSRLASKGEKHRQPSAATTRWLITALPSPAQDHRPGLATPHWQLHLWRQRNGPPGCWTITLQDHSWQPATLDSHSKTALAVHDDARFFPGSRHAVATG
jgi:protein ImuA